MSDAARGGTPSHNVQVHNGADRELNNLRGQCDIEDLEKRLEAVARERQPKNHPTVEPVEGDDRLIRVRGDGVRAVCSLAKPYLLVLLVGKRRTVYDRLSVAQARLRDWEGGIDG